jgi:pimeloyl-ACP methyl ester carboxylesterase
MSLDRMGNGKVRYLMVKTSEQLMAEAKLRAQGKSVSVDGIETKYWLYPSSTKNAKNLILVHGYRGDHHGLEAFAGGFSDFNVYTPDLPGFGVSHALAKEHSLESYSDWFKDFVSAIGLVNPIAVGHSFGTLVLSSCESKNNLFSKVILVNPVGGGKMTGVSKFLVEFVKFYYWIAHMLPERLGTRMTKTYALVDSMSAFTTKSKDKNLRKWIKLQHRTHFNSFANSQVVWESYLASTENVVTPYVKEIHKPVLLIAADLDEITPVYTVREMAESMDNAEVYEIKNCGHLVHYEAASEALSVMNAFLAKDS